MTLYVKKPIPVEAIQFTRENWEEVKTFLGDSFISINFMYLDSAKLVISTLEGNMNAKENDYIIRGVRGEIYSCDKDIFEETYEVYDESI